MFVVVAGKSYRTGTTLVQRLLNTTRKCMIFGENNIILRATGAEIYQYNGSSERHQKQVDKFLEDPNGFYPNIQPPKGVFQKSILDRFSIYNHPGMLHSGFKVIGFGEESKYASDVMFFKVIYCVRNPESIKESYKAMYQGYPAEKHLDGIYSGSIDEKTIEDNENYFIFDYDNLSRNLCVALMDWLSLPYFSINKVLGLKLREMDDFTNIQGHELTRPIREEVFV